MMRCFTSESSLHNIFKLTFRGVFLGFSWDGHDFCCMHHLINLRIENWESFVLMCFIESFLFSPASSPPVSALQQPQGQDLLGKNRMSKKLSLQEHICTCLHNPSHTSRDIDLVHQLDLCDQGTAQMQSRFLMLRRNALKLSRSTGQPIIAALRCHNGQRLSLCHWWSLDRRVFRIVFACNKNHPTSRQRVICSRKAERSSVTFDGSFCWLVESKDWNHLWKGITWNSNLQ